MFKLEVKNLNKSFGHTQVLKDINFDIKDGEFISILGPSGCGKSTLLKVLIGLEDFDSGEVILSGKDISRLKPKDRHMGMVFQNYALFPNMSVLQNVEYALKFNAETKKDSRARALTIIEAVGLAEFINKKPHKLSGGQQQRVAIARTLAMNPEIILFDEPMSALDANLKVILREEILSIQKKFNSTIIYITHDQEEAITMSDRVIVMSNSVIEQIGTPQEIIKEPKTEYVKEFVVANITKKTKAITKFIK